MDLFDLAVQRAINGSGGGDIDPQYNLIVDFTWDTNLNTYRFSTDYETIADAYLEFGKHIFGRCDDGSLVPILYIGDEGFVLASQLTAENDFVSISGWSFGADSIKASARICDGTYNRYYESAETIEVNIQNNMGYVISVDGTTISSAGSTWMPLKRGWVDSYIYVYSGHSSADLRNITVTTYGTGTFSEVTSYSNENNKNTSIIYVNFEYDSTKTYGIELYPANTALE